MAFQCSITQGQQFLQVVFKTFISFMFCPLLILWLFRNSKHDISGFFTRLCRIIQHYWLYSFSFIFLSSLIDSFLRTKLHSFWVKNLVVYVDMYDWSFSHSFPHFSSFPFQVDLHTHTHTHISYFCSICKFPHSKSSQNKTTTSCNLHSCNLVFAKFWIRSKK